MLGKKVLYTSEMHWSLGHGGNNGYRVNAPLSVVFELKGDVVGAYDLTLDCPLDGTEYDEKYIVHYKSIILLFSKYASKPHFGYKQSKTNTELFINKLAPKLRHYFKMPTIALPIRDRIKAEFEKDGVRIDATKEGHKRLTKRANSLIEWYYKVNTQVLGVNRLGKTSKNGVHLIDIKAVLSTIDTPQMKEILAGYKKVI